MEFLWAAASEPADSKGRVLSLLCLLLALLGIWMLYTGSKK